MRAAAAVGRGSRPKPRGREVRCGGVALLLLCLAVPAFALGAPAQTTDADQAGFIKAVKEYRGYVTPRCAPEMVEPYERYNMERDRAFVQSLRGTLLEKVYFAALSEAAEEDQMTVFECSGPPPPPPPPGAKTVPISPRAVAIADAQKRLQEEADDMPKYFDAGDRAFEHLVDIRNSILAGGAQGRSSSQSSPSSPAASPTSSSGG